MTRPLRALRRGHRLIARWRHPRPYCLAPQRSLFDATEDAV